MPDDFAPPQPIMDAIAELKENIAKTQQEVSALQIASKQPEGQWFRSPSITISALALVFSFGTTAVSYIRTNQQDIHDARSELRNLIQRLDQLPRENVDYFTKYANIPLAQNQVSTLLNSENAMLAKDAADVIDRIPNNVSATEYLAAARALSNSALVDKALKLAQRGLNVSNDVNDELDLLIFDATVLFSVGSLEQGRAQYKKALDIFSKYPSLNTYYIEQSHTITEMSWALSESNSHQCNYLTSHVTEAQRHLSMLAPGTMTDSLKNQLAKVEETAKSCVP